MLSSNTYTNNQYRQFSSQLLIIVGGGHTATRSPRIKPTATSQLVVVAQIIEMNAILPKNNLGRIPHTLMLPETDVQCIAYSREKLINL